MAEKLSELCCIVKSTGKIMNWQKLDADIMKPTLVVLIEIEKCYRNQMEKWAIGFNSWNICH